MFLTILFCEFVGGGLSPQKERAILKNKNKQCKWLDGWNEGAGGGGMQRADLNKIGPSNAFSMQLTSLKQLAHINFPLCFRVLLNWETFSDPHSQLKDQCPVTPHGTYCGLASLVS